MKTIFFYLCIATTFVACIHSDKTKEESNQEKPLGLLSNATTNVIKVPYDSAIIEVCDTAHIAVPYDSVWTYLGDTCRPKKRWRHGADTACGPIVKYGHKTAYYDSLDIHCHLDTLQGLRDSIPPAITTTEFGAKLQGDVDSQIVALKAMGATWVRTGIILSQYTGGRDKAIDKYFAAGLHVALNLTWSATKPAPFCTDTTLYANKLRLFFKTYAADFIKNGGFVMCENEPMNLGYYGSAPIEDYITLCKIFVRIAAENGIKSADGCTFVEYLNLARTGNWSSRFDEKMATQKKLLAAFKTIPFTYLNVHLLIKDDQLQTDLIKNSLDYLRAQTGHDLVVTNEYHFENCTAGSGIAKTTIAEWKKAKVGVCIVWSGDKVDGVLLKGGNSEADALSNGTVLTDFGKDYSAAIKN